MSRITRVLLPAVFIIALCGIAASSASATEDPYYKLNGGRLNAGETREIGLKGFSATQVLKATGAGITITCTGIATKPGATINGSKKEEPGTSAGQIEYSECTTTGNGKCIVTSVAGAKDKKIVTNALKDELVLAEEKPVKGTRLLDLFKPASGSVFVELKFDPLNVGEECKFKTTTVEGSVDVEILNSKEEPVTFEGVEKAEPKGPLEKEEEFGFIKSLPGSTKECKLKEGKLDKCTLSSLKAFGVSSTLEGTAEAFLGKTNAKGEAEKTGVLFGVFAK